MSNFLKCFEDLQATAHGPLRGLGLQSENLWLTLVFNDSVCHRF